MKLTIDELNMIRSLRWTKREFGDDIYNTPINMTHTQLFWFDFFKYIFSKRFSQQYALTEINNFDISQPVLLSDDYELVLPPSLETVNYYYENKKESPVRFSVNVLKIQVLIFSILALICLVVLNHAYPRSKILNMPII